MLRLALPCLLVCACLVTVVSCKDEAPPTWPAQAALEATEVGSSSVQLKWPAAVDEEGVTTYRLMMSIPEATQKDSIADLAGSARSFTATELDEAARLRFTLQALDAAGNPSAGLSLEVETKDGTPPSWPAGAQVSSGPIIEAGAGPDKGVSKVDRLQLAWPAATDAVGVSAYRIMRGDKEVLTLDGGRTDTLFHPSIQRAEHSLRAGDAAGNWSQPLTIDLSLLEERRQEAARTMAAKRAALEKKIIKKGLLKILGTRGLDSGGMVSDVLASGVGGDPDPFEGVGGVMVAGGRPRDRERIRGKVHVGKIEADQDALIPKFKKTLKRRAGRFKACYEKRLKVSPDLRGKIVLQLSLERGRVRSVSVESDTMGDAGLQACIKRSAKTLRLPDAAGQVTATLIFARDK